MSYFHPIKTIEDQERLLKTVLALQTQIRTKRKKNRLADKSRSTKYAKIFEPITRTLKDLGDVPVKTSHLLNADVPTTNNDLVDLLSPDAVKVKHEDEDEGPGELYRAALRAVAVDDRDDGRFGLNTITEKIGDYIFTVDGNTLKLINDEDVEHEIVIDDIYTWIILLAKSPGAYMILSQKRGQSTPSKNSRQRGEYIPAVKRYVEIANTLNLIETAKEHGWRYKSLSKYKIIETENSRSGNGFLFSTKPPPFVKPSTVVIPSDKKGLMRELVKALSELRAGNTSMRNIVVPLAQEARRKNILPKYLLEPDEETWVYA